MSGTPMGHLRVQIPAYNEADTIGDVVAEALRCGESLVGRQGRLSVLVVDDGSTDGTGDIVSALGRRDSRVRLHRNPHNLGLGTCFRLGLVEAVRDQADILVHIDGDGQFEAADMTALVEPIRNGMSDVVSASRFADPGKTPPMTWYRKMGNRVFARLVSAASGRPLYDVSCGFRAYSRPAMALLGEELRGEYTYTHESLVRCSRAGLRIAEVPCDIRGERAHGRSRLAPNPLIYGIRAGTILARTWWEQAPPARLSGASGHRASVATALGGARRGRP